MSKTIKHSFTVSENEKASARPVTVDVPERMADLSERAQARLYHKALSSCTIDVQRRLRAWISKNRAASADALNAEAQGFMDQALKGESVRAARTVVVEVVKTMQIDATAVRLSKEQIAHFSAQEGVELVNVPEAMQKYLVSESK